MSWRCPLPMPIQGNNVISCACISVPRTSAGRCAGGTVSIIVVQRSCVVPASRWWQASRYQASLGRQYVVFRKSCELEVYGKREDWVGEDPKESAWLGPVPDRCAHQAGTSPLLLQCCWWFSVVVGYFSRIQLSSELSTKDLPMLQVGYG